MGICLLSGKNFKCIKCNFKSCTKVGLIVHETEKHRKKKPKKYRCDECGKKCRNAFKLLNHKIMSHSEKIFDKNSSMKTWRKRTKMEYDITVENYENTSSTKIVQKKSEEIEILSQKINHKCPQCDCTYKVTAGLKMHVKTALKENSLKKCQQCQFISCTRKGMQFHEKVLHLKNNVASFEKSSTNEDPKTTSSKKSNDENVKSKIADFQKELVEDATIADPVSMEKVLENPD